MACWMVTGFLFFLDEPHRYPSIAHLCGGGTGRESVPGFGVVASQPAGRKRPCQAAGGIARCRAFRTLTLTLGGRHLMTRAEQVLAAHKALLDEAILLKDELGGRIRLGTVSDPDILQLGPFLALMSERHPNVEVQVCQGRSEAILNAVKGGQLAFPPRYCRTIGPSGRSASARRSTDEACGETVPGTIST